jgi:cytoskeletal protein RodZ
MNRGLQVMSKDIPQPDQQQAQRLAEIGDYLRQVREANFMTIEQMATKTLIQARLLNAIETGNLRLLPEPVYIRGFIKRYAQLLGLDGAEIADAFPVDTGIQAVQPSWKDSPAAQLRPLHLWVAYVLLIIAAVSGLSYLISRSASWVTAQPDVKPSPLAAVSPSRPAASSKSSPPSSPTAVTSPSPTTSSQPVRIDVTLTAQSWLRVEVDGKTDYEGVLLEGTQRTWTASKALTVRAGNAGGVMVAYNNGQAKAMGEPGTVKEISFPPSQDAASLPSSASARSQ